MTDKSKVEKLIDRANKCLNSNERTNVRKTWEKIGKYILQSSGDNFNFDTMSTRGKAVNQEVFDSAPATYCRDLASALHSTITNPMMRWSKFKFKDEHLNNDDEAVRWLDACSDKIHSRLSDSNFDNQVGSGYSSYVALGTMILMHDEKIKDNHFDGFSFKALHLGDAAIEVSSEGIPDSLYRKFKCSPRQAMELFPEENAYADMVKNNCEEEVEFLQAIYPRPSSEVKLNDVGLAPDEHRPIADCYVDVVRKKIVKEHGYYEVPFYAPRWSTRPQEVYGFSPGHVAMPDVLTLNKLRKEMLKGLAKSVNPAIMTTQNGLIQGNFNPGTIVKVRDVKQVQEIGTATRFEVAFNFVEDIKNSIKQSFYIDKLMLPPRTETGEMTAYEVSQRLEQMQQILGSVVSRLNTEFLNPFIIRCFNILLRNGDLPEPPVSLMQGGKLDVDIQYVNSLARSQQTAELRNVQTWMMEVGHLVQLQAAGQQSPLLDGIDFDEIVKYSARLRSIPEPILLSDKKVAATRQQRAEQMQQQQMLNAGQQIGSIAKDLTHGSGGANGR